MINPTAMMDARTRNQIGQPAASTIANTRILQMCLNLWSPSKPYALFRYDLPEGYQGATVTCHIQLSKISQIFLE